jgi:hypothetical protein
LSKSNEILLGKNNNIDITYFPSAKIWNFNSYSLRLVEELFHIHSIQLTWVWRALVLFIQYIPNLLYDFGQLTLLLGFHLIKTPCNIRLNFFYHTSGGGRKKKTQNLEIILKQLHDTSESLLGHLDDIILTSLAIHKLGMFAYAVHKMWNSLSFARNQNVEDLFCFWFVYWALPWDYLIGSNFWKFYLIKTGFILGELVSLVKVFRLFRLERIFLVFRVWTQ